MFRPAARRLLVGLLALAFAGTAAADARESLHAAFLKNMAAKSYRATMTDLATGKPVSTVEFQAPDRYRISIAGGPTSVIADGKMFVAQSAISVNGMSPHHRPNLAVPLPPGTLEKFRSDSAWKQVEANTQISDAGVGTVGAEPARKYHWVSSGQHPSAGDMWVSLGSGRVIQVETARQAGSKAGGVRVRYSDFDSAAIRISPPK